MSSAIAARFVYRDLTLLVAVLAVEPPKKTLGCTRITLRLNEYIQQIANLINRPAPDDYFIDMGNIAVASRLALKAGGINTSLPYTPETVCFSTNSVASLGKQIFDITVAEIKSTYSQTAYEVISGGNHWSL